MKNNIFDLRVQNIIKKLRHLSKITAVKSNDILLGPPITNAKRKHKTRHRYILNRTQTGKLAIIK